MSYEPDATDEAMPEVPEWILSSGLELLWKLSSQGNSQLSNEFPVEVEMESGNAPLLFPVSEDRDEVGTGDLSFVNKLERGPVAQAVDVKVEVAAVHEPHECTPVPATPPDHAVGALKAEDAGAEDTAYDETMRVKEFMEFFDATVASTNSDLFGECGEGGEGADDLSRPVVVPPSPSPPSRKRVRVDRVVHLTKKIMAELNKARDGESVRALFAIIADTVAVSVVPNVLPFVMDCFSGSAAAPSSPVPVCVPVCGAPVVPVPVSGAPVVPVPTLPVPAPLPPVAVAAPAPAPARALDAPLDPSYSFLMDLASSGGESSAGCDDLYAGVHDVFGDLGCGDRGVVSEVRLPVVLPPRTKVPRKHHVVATRSSLFPTIQVEVNERLYGFKSRKIDLIIRECLTLGYTWHDLQVVEEIARRVQYFRKNCGSFRSISVMITSRYGRCQGTCEVREPWGHNFPYWEVRYQNNHRELRLSPEFFGGSGGDLEGVATC